jgi:hypothetical protein
MNENTARYALVAAALGLFAYQNDLPAKLGLGKPPAPAVVVDDYEGDMTKLHKASREMVPEHRAALAEAFSSGASGLRDDPGTVQTTAQWQRYVEAVSQFAYRDMGRVDKRYPDVADLIQVEVSRVAGGEEVAIGPRKREFVSVLSDIADAVR